MKSRLFSNLLGETKTSLLQIGGIMKRLKYIALAAIILFIFTACSNPTFDNAIDKGLEGLTEKKYSTAVSYFEIALERRIVQKRDHIWSKLSF